MNTLRNKVRGWIKPSTAILAGCAVAAVLLLMPASSQSVDWGCGVHGCGEWVPTAAAANHSSTCLSANQGNLCEEWCEENPLTGQLVPTGQFCCTGGDGVCNASDLFID